MKFNSCSFQGLLKSASAFLTLTVMAISITGCQWGDEVETLVQPNPDNFQVLFSDTSTVITSTVMYDSLMTGSASRMLTGRLDDPYLGKMLAMPFFQPTLASAVTIPEEAVYDSLVLSLGYDKYFYGDTTKLMTISAHALDVDILSKNVYFNNNVTSYSPTALGTKSFYPMPNAESTVKIKLSNTLGKEIFDKGKGNLLTSNEQWINILKGLTLVTKSTYNSGVVGFQTSSDSTAITLHYHTVGTDGVTNGTAVFKNTALYNHIQGDRSKTALALLGNNRRIALPSASSGEKTFIQEGTGIMTRVDLPNIRTLKDTKYSVSNRAFLRITPIKESITKVLTAPPTLYVYLCDKNNQPPGGYVTALTDLNNNAVSGAYVNDLVNNTEYYLFDVSAYVTAILNSESSEANGLLLLTTPLNASSTYPEADVQSSSGYVSREIVKGLRRLVIGSQKNADRGVKLELYYTTVKAQ